MATCTVLQNDKMTYTQKVPERYTIEVSICLFQNMKEDDCYQDMGEEDLNYLYYCHCGLMVVD